jgi:hypothetical protein
MADGIVIISFEQKDVLLKKWEDYSSSCQGSAKTEGTALDSSRNKDTERHLHAQVEGLLESITNENIRWDGTGVGLVYYPDEQLRLALNSIPREYLSIVYKYLNDPKRFAAAHVILCQVSGKYPTNAGTFSELNGMGVSLMGDGTVVIPFEQKDVLLNKWKDYSESPP